MTALACVAITDSATIGHGKLRPASRYEWRSRLPRPRQFPYATKPSSATPSTIQSSVLRRNSA